MTAVKQDLQKRLDQAHAWANSPDASPESRAGWEKIVEKVRQDLTRPVARNVRIHLASNEWGNVFMGKVAEAAFKELGVDLVTVYEHAGWYLEYAKRPDGTLMVVGTANDMAGFPREVEEWGAKLAGHIWETLPEIRRGD
jgi:hypothetical protein